MAMRKPRILLVDDERVVVEVLTSLLDDPDREILPADSAASALEHARAGEIEVALVDKNLGADSGLELSRELKQMQPEIEIILITGYASMESAIQAMQIGAFDYLTKPIADFAALSVKVQSALEKSQLRRSQAALLERLMECQVRHRRLIDAAPEAIVLYDGETGLVMEANEAAVKLYGYLPQELLRAAASDLRGGSPEGKPGPVPVLQCHRRRDGSEFIAEVTFTEFQQQGRTLRVQSVRDVSERERGEARRLELEDRFRPAQRLDAIGRLAGSVAQDFKGLLAVISSHATALQSGLRDLHALRAEADAIVRAAARGNALTQQLELFSHRVPHDGRQPNINAIASEARDPASGLSGDDVARPAASLEASPGRGKGERILLVEDEESLRVMMRRMLLSHGYDVLDAPNAEEGLRVVEGRSIDLLLTDVDRPCVDGEDLARKLIANHPTLRVLYIGESATERSIGVPEQVIRKPFTPIALLGQVRRLLDGTVQ
jgi:PAS domain S-box-containing protein